jgi:hypothetical protein
MVHDVQNYWVSELCPSSGIVDNWKLDQFPSSGEGREARKYA